MANTQERSCLGSIVFLFALLACIPFTQQITGCRTLEFQQVFPCLIKDKDKMSRLAFLSLLMNYNSNSICTVISLKVVLEYTAPNKDDIDSLDECIL